MKSQETRWYSFFFDYPLAIWETPRIWETLFESRETNDHGTEHRGGFHKAGNREKDVRAGLLFLLWSSARWTVNDRSRIIHGPSGHVIVSSLVALIQALYAQSAWIITRGALLLPVNFPWLSFRPFTWPLLPRVSPSISVIFRSSFAFFNSFLSFLDLVSTTHNANAWIITRNYFCYFLSCLTYRR